MGHEQNFRDRITHIPTEQKISQESQDIVREFTKLAAYIIACPEDEFDGKGTRDKIKDLCKRWINLSNPSEIIDMAKAMIESKMPSQIVSTFIGNFIYRLLNSMGRFDDNETEE